MAIKDINKILEVTIKEYYYLLKLQVKEFKQKNTSSKFISEQDEEYHFTDIFLIHTAATKVLWSSIQAISFIDI